MTPANLPAADALLTKLNEAVKAANFAEKTVTMAQDELVSRSKTVACCFLRLKNFILQ